MVRQEWYALYRDVRTTVFGENLFRAMLKPTDESAIEIAKILRKKAYKDAMNKRHQRND